MYGDAMKEAWGIPSTKVGTSIVQNVKDVSTGADDGSATKEASTPDWTASERAEGCAAVRDEFRRGLKELGMNPRLFGGISSECTNTNPGPESSSVIDLCASSSIPQICPLQSW